MDLGERTNTHRYCRYCAHCFCGGEDDYRCNEHPKGEQPHWSEKEVAKRTGCKNFEMCDIGCVITGKQYEPRKPKPKPDPRFKQLSFL
jgi:hypothetical protein